MSVKQLTIYIENKPGNISKVTDLLTANGIDMRSLVLADTEKFGILRLLVNDPEKAVGILGDNGIMANVVDITAVKIANETGGLDKVLKLTTDNGINIEYMYAFVATDGNSAFAVLKFDDIEKGQGILRRAGFAVLDENEL